MAKTNDIRIAEPGTAQQRAAMASPLRLEIIGLFAAQSPLSITDMAERMGRTPGSLYHHVGILEEAGLLLRAGTRPKGKRFETLFTVPANFPSVDTSPDDENSVTEATNIMAAAFRMTERDLEAALRGQSVMEGPDRNMLATRIHMRISPDSLARLNELLDSILELLTHRAEESPSPSDDDQMLSLTLALLPLKGRSPSGGNPKNAAADGGESSRRSDPS